MAIFVTGGAGYIGSHTVKELIKKGYETIVYDNLSEGHREAVGNAELIAGDLSDTILLSKTFETHKIDAVIHFASSCYVGESMQRPDKYYKNNIINGYNLLECMREHSVKNIIFSSSCATYGIPDAIPITETTQQKPINTYGLTKLIFERMLGDYQRAFEFNFVALRYFNAAGDDPELEIGENHDPETHVIPLMLDTALGLRDRFTVFGTDYNTPDGTCVRDYIHVLDIADAHIRALQYLEKGNQSVCVNLGTGDGVSVKRLIDIIRDVTGREFPVEYGDRRPGDPPALVASNDKAEEILGWKPAYSDIEYIIKTAWGWQKKLKNIK